MDERSPEQQLDEFIAKYTPAIGDVARGALTKMRARLPGAIELVYDNYNALAIGFSATEKTSDVIASITLYLRWVSLFFMYGAVLPDPHKLLKGSSKQVRHIVLKDASTLDEPAVQSLLAAAMEAADKPLDRAATNRIIIKSISAQQRARRPA